MQVQIKPRSQKAAMLMVLATLVLAAGCSSTLNGLKQDIGKVTSGSDNAQEQTESADDQSECSRNFSVTGNFFSGKRYHAYQEFSGISESRAFKNVAQYMATKGWTVVNTDPELGVMTATQGAVGSRVAKNIPLNISVRKQSSGKVRVQASLSLSFGVVTSAQGQKNELCGVIESAA